MEKKKKTECSPGNSFRFLEDRGGKHQVKLLEAYKRGEKTEEKKEKKERKAMEQETSTLTAV